LAEPERLWIFGRFSWQSGNDCRPMGTNKRKIARCFPISATFRDQAKIQIGAERNERTGHDHL